MGFLKKLAGVFGFGQEVVRNEEDDGGESTGIDSGDGDKLREDNQPRFRETGLPRKGFGVPVQVTVERSHLGPVLQPYSAGDGGIQVCSWKKKNRDDDDDFTHVPMLPKLPLEYITVKKKLANWKKHKVKQKLKATETCFGNQIVFPWNVRRKNVRGRGKKKLVYERVHLRFDKWMKHNKKLAAKRNRGSIKSL